MRPGDKLFTQKDRAYLLQAHHCDCNPANNSPKNLVIVESPTKCGTVKKILGSQYEVKASYGHIAQLTKSGESDTGIRIEDGRVICDYEPTDRGKATLAELKRAVKEATMVYLATDEDREGEGIFSNGLPD